MTSSALSATSLQAHSEACRDPSASTEQCTRAGRRMRKHLSFFAECFLFHLFLCFEKEKKESVLNVMYRDSGSETAAVLLFSSKHPHAQWPFISRSLTWQELRLPCHQQLLQTQRDQDLQPQVMDSIHIHRVCWAPWSLGPCNVTLGMHLPSPAQHLHFTACAKSKHLTFFLQC